MISARFVQSSVQAARSDIAKIDRTAQRASLWALRETGRVVGREARKRARVYGGTTKSVSLANRRTFKVTTGAKGSDGKRAYGKTVGVEPGLLKASIKSSRRVTRGAGTFRIAVGPRGGHVHLYAQKIEKLQPYMSPAHDIGAARAFAIHERALERAIRRAAR